MQQTNEINNKDFADELISTLVNELMNKFKIDYNSQQIFGGLLTSTIEPILKHKTGLLNVYVNTELELIASTMKAEFNISEPIDIDKTHATHARFNTLIKAIKNKLKK